MSDLAEFSPLAFTADGVNGRREEVLKKIGVEGNAEETESKVQCKRI